jgi:hypothetical protein
MYDFSLLKSENSRMTYNGERLPRLPLIGARPKFGLGDEFIIKMDAGTANPQSSTELLLWESLDEADKRYFAPIEFGRKFVSAESLGFIVQKRLNVNTDGSAKSGEAWGIVLDLKRKYNLSDLYDGGCENWGMVDGSPVILDYGLGDMFYSIRVPMSEGGTRLYN